MAKVNVVDLKVSTSELAAIIGKSPQWVRKLTREGVITQVARGRYKLSDAVQAFYEFKTGENSDNELNYNREKALLTRAKRKLEENKLQIMEGKLHRAEDVEIIMNTMLLNFRSRLLTIPSRLAPGITGKTEIAVVNKLIKREVYTVLEELSKYDPEDFRPEDLEFIENDETEIEQEFNTKAGKTNKDF